MQALKCMAQLEKGKLGWAVVGLKLSAPAVDTRRVNLLMLLSNDLQLLL